MVFSSYNSSRNFCLIFLKSDPSCMSMTNGHKWRTAAVSNHGQASNILVESSSLINYSPVKSNGHTSRYSFDDSQNMHVIKNWKFLKKKPSPATSGRLNDSECSQQVCKIKLQFISVVIYRQSPIFSSITKTSFSPISCKYLQATTANV